MDAEWMPAKKRDNRRDRNNDLTDYFVYIDAQKYTSASEWEEKSPKCYEKALFDFDLFELCTVHMKESYNLCMSEAVSKVAKKYKCQREWRLASPRSYKVALQDIELFKRCTSHMKANVRIITKSDAINTARQFSTPIDWAFNSKETYSFARNNPLLYEDCISHMDSSDPFKPFSEIYLIKEGRKYTTCKEWKKCNPLTYLEAMKDSVVWNLATSHMKRKKRLWTEETLLIEARKYSSRTEWSNLSRSSYLKARKNKRVFNLCTEHMDISTQTPETDELLRLLTNRKYVIKT